jgi:hypothetical protein
MTSIDYGNFFNAALALFPILVLTKTVSYRSRRTSPGEQISGNVQQTSRNARSLASFIKKPGPAGHVVHVIAATVGEIVAIIGIWGQTKGVLIARIVALLLILAAIPLVLELLGDATRP